MSAKLLLPSPRRVRPPPLRTLLIVYLLNAGWSHAQARTQLGMTRGEYYGRLWRYRRRGQPYEPPSQQRGSDWETRLTERWVDRQRRAA